MVRRAEFFRQGKQTRELVKGKRWLLFTRWVNLTEQKQQALNQLFRMNRPVMEACLLKESLEGLWKQRDALEGVEYLIACDLPSHPRSAPTGGGASAGPSRQAALLAQLSPYKKGNPTATIAPGLADPRDPDGLFPWVCNLTPYGRTVKSWNASANSGQTSGGAGAFRFQNVFMPPRFWHRGSLSYGGRQNVRKEPPLARTFLEAPRIRRIPRQTEQ